MVSFINCKATSPAHDSVFATGDGLCYLQIVLAGDAESGVVPSTDFGSAAYTMIQQCVVKYGYGGIVSQIGKLTIANSGLLYMMTLTPNIWTGGDNNLEVIVAPYKPNVKCTKSPSPHWRSTISIFADMIATKKVETFGREDSLDIDVPLPFYLKQGDHFLI